MSHKQGDTKLLAVTSRNLNLTMAYLLTDNYLFIMNPATMLLIKTYSSHNLDIFFTDFTDRLPLHINSNKAGNHNKGH